MSKKTENCPKCKKPLALESDAHERIKFCVACGYRKAEARSTTLAPLDIEDVSKIPMPIVLCPKDGKQLKFKLTSSGARSLNCTCGYMWVLNVPAAEIDKKEYPQPISNQVPVPAILGDMEIGKDMTKEFLEKLGVAAGKTFSTETDALTFILSAKSTEEKTYKLDNQVKELKDKIAGLNLYPDEASILQFFRRMKHPNLKRAFLDMTIDLVTLAEGRAELPEPIKITEDAA